MGGCYHISMNIYFSDCKNDEYKQFVNTALLTASKVLKIDDAKLCVNFAFVNKKEIKTLNKNFRSVDKVTDVLSFPALSPVKDNIITKDLNEKNYPHDINPDTREIILGDIYLCLDVAKKQAKEYSTGIMREIMYLSVHGLLHLLGYDHIVETDKIVMREMEEKIMSEVK